MTPRFSIIIPAYNAAKTIGTTLEKVFVQSFQDFEIIVVNDGSKDNVEEVLKPYFSERFQYTRQENQGPGAARNTGAALAKGEYLVFLDSDDYVEQDWLEEFHQLSANGAGLMAIALKMPNGLIRPPKSVTAKGRNFRVLPIPGTFAVDRNLFQQVGGYDTQLRQSENWEMLDRVIRHCQKNEIATVHSDRALLIYNKNMGAEKFADRAANKAQAAIYLVEKYGDEMNALKKSRYLSRAGVNLFRIGKISEARAYFFKAIAASPLSLNHYFRLIVSFFPSLSKRLWRNRFEESK